MKKIGRPTKMTPETVERILRCAEKGMPLTLAASAAGVSFQSVCNHRQRRPRFAEALTEAVAKGVEKRLEKIESASESGDWRAAAWLLEHCQPEHFAKTRIQVEAVGQFDHAFVIPRETLDQIAEARAKHERESLNGNAPATMLETKNRTEPLNKTQS